MSPSPDGRRMRAQRAELPRSLREGVGGRVVLTNPGSGAHSSVSSVIRAWPPSNLSSRMGGRDCPDPEAIRTVHGPEEALRGGQLCPSCSCLRHHRRHLSLGQPKGPQAAGKDESVGLVLVWLCPRPVWDLGECVHFLRPSSRAGGRPGMRGAVCCVPDIGVHPWGQDGVRHRHVGREAQPS